MNKLNLWRVSPDVVKQCQEELTLCAFWGSCKMSCGVGTLRLPLFWFAAKEQETLPTTLVLTQFCSFDVGSNVLTKGFEVCCMSSVTGLRLLFSQHKLELQVKFGPLITNSKRKPHVPSLSSLPSESIQHSLKINMRSGKTLLLLFGYHKGKNSLLLLQDKLTLLISITEVPALRKLAFL